MTTSIFRYETYKELKLTCVYWRKVLKGGDSPWAIEIGVEGSSSTLRLG